MGPGRKKMKFPCPLIRNSKLNNPDPKVKMMDMIKLIKFQEKEKTKENQETKKTQMRFQVQNWLKILEQN